MQGCRRPRRASRGSSRSDRLTTSITPWVMIVRGSSFAASARCRSSRRVKRGDDVVLESCTVGRHDGHLEDHGLRTALPDDAGDEGAVTAEHVDQAVDVVDDHSGVLRVARRFLPDADGLAVEGHLPVGAGAAARAPLGGGAFFSAGNHGCFPRPVSSTATTGGCSAGGTAFEGRVLHRRRGCARRCRGCRTRPPHRRRRPRAPPPPQMPRRRPRCPAAAPDPRRRPRRRHQR